MSIAPPLVPTTPWVTHSVEITAVVPEITGVATYHLRLTDAAARNAYSCEPGRFNMLYLPCVGEAAISVSGHDAVADTWLHTVRTAGGVTQTLAGLGPGGKLALRGPFGTAWPTEQFAGRDVVFVAGGIGLAPLRPAIEWALQQRQNCGRLTLLYGARSPQTILYAAEFDQWRQRGLNIEITVDRTDPGWLGRVGVVTLLLDRLRPLDPQKTIMLTCGPDVMMRYVTRSALDRGLKMTQIWVSLERNMQCAVGFCGHCQLGPAFICKDGPVFRYDRMAPYLDLEDL
jgi:NAD(P)H-flavin reductase